MSSEVLIVDDEKDICSYLRELVASKLLCHADTANNGLDAFLKCRDKKYKLIITDHRMPFMQGAAFIVAIRTKENLNKDTPVIFMSAHPKHEMKEALTVKDVDFVAKPIDESHFLDIITNLL